MNAGEALRQFRFEIGELNSHFPFDSELFGYLNEGYKQFVRLGDGVPDELELDVTANEPEVEIPEYVIRVREVKKLSDGKRLEVINYTDLNKKATTDYGRTVSLPINMDEVGDLRYFMIGQKRKMARLIGVPAVNDTLRLYIDRMPTVEIKSENQKLSDIDEVFHSALLDWMKARMYRKATEGVFNPNMGEYFEKRFRASADEAGKAQVLFKTKKRVVGYGGY